MGRAEGAEASRSRPEASAALTEGGTPHDLTTVKCHCGSVSSLEEALFPQRDSDAGDLFGTSVV